MGWQFENFAWQSIPADVLDCINQKNYQILRTYLNYNMPPFEELRTMVNADGAYQGRDDNGLVKNWAFTADEFTPPVERASVFHGQQISAEGEILFRMSYPIQKFEGATGSSKKSSSKGSVQSYGSSWSQHR